MKTRRVLAAAVLAALVGAGVGCNSYVAPGRGADITPAGLERLRAQQTDTSIADLLARKPLAQFPTAIAVARVQSSGYSSYTTQGYGQGAFTLVTTRDVEMAADIERLEKLEQIKGIAPTSRMVVNQNIHTDEDIRRGAAMLGADVLLMYTLDTAIKTNDKAAPLSVISLGLSPNQVVTVSTTASAIFLDTRNGFVYGTAEATDQTSQLASAWTNSDAADEARKRVETRTFGKLVREIEKTWSGVVRTYGAKGAGVASAK